MQIDKNSWSKSKFCDVIESITNRIDSPSEAGVERYVGLEHLDPGSMTVNRWGTPDQVEAAKLLFEKGDVIFGRRRAYQRKVSMADFRGICSAHALVLRAKPGLIDPSFLPVFLSSDTFLNLAIKISVGSLSPTVNWKTLATQEFLFPPLDQQREIASTFWELSTLLNSLKEISVDLAAMKSLVFTECVDGVKTPSTITSLSKVADLVIGRTPSKSDKSYWTSSQAYPFCTIADMTDNQVSGTKLGVTKKALDEGKAKLVKAGTLMMSFKLTVGRLAYAKVDLCPNEAIVAIKPDNKLIGLDFLELTLAHSEFSKNSNRAVMGFTLNSQSLNKIEIVCPDLEMQEQIMSKMLPIDTALRVIDNEIQATSALIEKLSRVFFGGES
jgi:type I restriction enzyme S subunit